MNAEILHDALNLLPGDLITATDKLRSAPREKKTNWMRYVSMAACIALILCGGFLFTSRFFGMGGSTEAMLEESLQYAADNAAGEAEEPKDVFPASTEGKLPNGTGEGAGEAPAMDAPAETTVCGSEGTEAASAWTNAQTQYIQTPMLDNTLCIDKASLNTRLIRSRQELEGYYEDNKAFYDMDSFYESCRVYDDAFFAENDLLLVEVEEVYDTIHHDVLGLTRQEDGSWELAIRRLDLNMSRADSPIRMCILMDVRKDSVDAEDVVNVVFE